MRARLLVLSLVIAATSLAGSPENFPYVFKRGTASMVRVNGSLQNYLRMKDRWQGEYIWVKRGGREYLIRDNAVLAEAERAFAPMRALEPQVRAAEARLRPLEERADALSDIDGDDAAAETELEKLEPALEAASREVERLDDEMERREVIAEKNFEQIVIKAIKAGKATRVD